MAIRRDLHAPDGQSARPLFLGSTGSRFVLASRAAAVRWRLAAVMLIPCQKARQRAEQPPVPSLGPAFMTHIQCWRPPVTRFTSTRSM